MTDTGELANSADDVELALSREEFKAHEGYGFVPGDYALSYMAAARLLFQSPHIECLKKGWAYRCLCDGKPGKCKPGACEDGWCLLQGGAL
jgi:hypothetical protein